MRRSLHGVEVEVTGSLPAELLAELLGEFPERTPVREPDLSIRLEPLAGPAGAEGQPIFFHGIVQARALEGAIVLTDGRSIARVAAGGAHIDLAVSPRSLEDQHAFEHVLALLALVVALRWRGLFHLHAAVLASGGGAVVVAGPAGSGKSTLALALLEHAGLAYLGDDAAFLALRSGGPRLLAFPRPFHVGAAAARAFPRVSSLLGADIGSGGKRRLDPGVAFPGRALAEAEAPRLVLLPVVSGRPTTRVSPVSRAAALGALIESSAMVAVDELPGAAGHLALLGAALDRAVAFSVELGTDMLQDPRAVVRAIEGLPGAPRMVPCSG